MELFKETERNGTVREGLNHRKSDGTVRSWMQCPKSDESSEIEIVGNWRDTVGI